MKLKQSIYCPAIIKIKLTFVFQIIVGSCSALIKQESENPKIADNLTVYLPDFSSGAIKSLLCLMYTGEGTQIKVLILILVIIVIICYEADNVVNICPFI